MTVTVTPAPITSPPNKYGGDPAAFDAAMQAHLDWQASSLVTQMNAQNVENNALNLNMNNQVAVALAAGLANAAANAGAATTAATTATTKATEAASSALLSDAARAAAVTAQNNAVAVVTGGTGSLTAAPGKLPLADANGRLHASWLSAISQTLINHIGVPGTAGFGQGICPTVPAGYTPMPGCTDALSANYGTYQFTDGSIMVWIPAFYFRLGHSGNPTFGTHGLNSIDVEPLSQFPDAATAAAEGYYLHRAFVNGGANQMGFFRDKYDCSNNAGTCSSIANASPIVSGPETGQIGFSSLTGAPTNAYHGAIAAAKTRGALFVPESIFMADAITRLTEAHAQAATSTTYCAWYSATTTNYPKGNNNNALRDVNDTSVIFTTAGSSAQPNFALAGSGLPFAKTTHNGQACGISDVNGNIFKINLGLTCIATNKAITGATATNPVALTVVGHGFVTGQTKRISSVVGMTQLNDRFFTITVTGVNTITLDGTDGTAFTAYASGGNAQTGQFYALKPSVNLTTITNGTTLATDHWGAVGAAAMFDPVTLNFPSVYPNNHSSQRFGNAANAVFDMSTAAGRTLAMMGMPAVGGVSTSGTTNFGQDEFYGQYQDQLCVVSRGHWYNGSNAGARSRNLPHARSFAGTYVGLACASYLT